MFNDNFLINRNNKHLLSSISLFLFYLLSMPAYSKDNDEYDILKHDFGPAEGRLFNLHRVEADSNILDGGRVVSIITKNGDTFNISFNTSDSGILRNVCVNAICTNISKRYEVMRFVPVMIGESVKVSVYDVSGIGRVIGVMLPVKMVEGGMGDQCSKIYRNNGNHNLYNRVSLFWESNGKLIQILVRGGQAMQLWRPDEYEKLISRESISLCEYDRLVYLVFDIVGDN